MIIYLKCKYNFLSFLWEISFINDYFPKKDLVVDISNLSNALEIQLKNFSYKHDLQNKIEYSKIFRSDEPFSFINYVEIKFLNNADYVLFLLKNS